MFCCEIDIWLNMGTYFSAIKMVLAYSYNLVFALLRITPIILLFVPLYLLPFFCPPEALRDCGKVSPTFEQTTHTHAYTHTLHGHFIQTVFDEMTCTYIEMFIYIYIKYIAKLF